jgi:4-carboxymuconolactone decarboxylase
VADGVSLGRETEGLVRASASLATRDAGRIRRTLADAVSHVDPRAMDEVILQAHLFVGFPDALNALRLWREVSETMAPWDGPETAGAWEARGAAVCERVYGANFGQLRRNVAALHPDLERWMLVGGYGRVIGREGLDLRTRELCIAALLAVWRVPRQLHSHLRGALNVGAAPWEVDRAVAIACEFLDPAGAASVQALWAEVRGRAADALR